MPYRPRNRLSAWPHAADCSTPHPGVDYHAGMSPHLLVGAMLALAGCATTPDVTQLCGSWASDEMREHWWIDGRDLHGAGRMIRDGVEVQTEALALRSSKSGHVYVATPGDELSPLPGAAGSSR